MKLAIFRFIYCPTRVAGGHNYGNFQQVTEHNWGKKNFPNWNIFPVFVIDIWLQGEKQYFMTVFISFIDFSLHIDLRSVI